MIKPILGAALVALCAGPVLAAEATLTQAQPGALRVSTAGLDLSQPRDVKRLEARVEKAIAAACTPHGSYFATLAPQRECRADLATKARPVLANLSRKADRSRMVEF